MMIAEKAILTMVEGTTVEDTKLLTIQGEAIMTVVRATAVEDMELLVFAEKAISAVVATTAVENTEQAGHWPTIPAVSAHHKAVKVEKRR